MLFAYGQDGQLLGEYDGNGKALREYVWLGNTPIVLFTPDAANVANPPLVYYIHTDHLDTPRIVSDKNDTRRWRWLAEPFGTTAPETNPDGLGVFTQNLRFPGQYADQESGLNYNYFRDYDASIGRYVESDPIGLDGGINTYAYVSGEPTSYVDQEGLAGGGPGAGTGGFSPGTLPGRVGRHNGLNNPHTQMAREWGPQINPDPFSPLPHVPGPPKPWCRAVCEPNGMCPVAQPIGVPLGGGCYEVCIPGPFADPTQPSAPEQPPEKPHQRSASPNEWGRLFDIIRRR